MPFGGWTSGGIFSVAPRGSERRGRGSAKHSSQPVCLGSCGHYLQPMHAMQGLDMRHSALTVSRQTGGYGIEKGCAEVGRELTNVEQHHCQVSDPHISPASTFASDLSQQIFRHGPTEWNAVQCTKHEDLSDQASADGGALACEVLTGCG
eukprot:Hpha_TRINITY_DN16554_c0_g2::TRINITY_DN16554_c0_g2_i3::g.134316::m.134316